MPTNGWIQRYEYPNGKHDKIRNDKGHLHTPIEAYGDYAGIRREGLKYEGHGNLPPETYQDLDDQIYPNLQTVANGMYVENEMGGFNVSDLRLLIAVQKAMELDMRTGSRYFEYIKTNFNTSPRNDALQRAEYIGQIQTQINMAEVLQTSATETNSSLGEMAGHGLGIHQGGKDLTYYCQEHGRVS